jgi:hypothetical protein
MAEEKGGSSAWRHEREREEEGRSQIGIRRCALHFCVAWEARPKMERPNRYSVGEDFFPATVMLTPHFGILSSPLEITL